MIKWLRQQLIGGLQPNNSHNSTLHPQTVRCNTMFHGSPYGGWTVCPDGLSPSSVVYSFGIGEDASFDLDILTHYGAELHAFDPTPRSIDWVKKQPSWPARFHFHPIGIGACDRMATFFPPEDPDHVSYSIVNRIAPTGSAIQVQLLRLKTITEMLGHKEIDILKMDIEGAEYEVIDDLVNTTELRVRQVLVEFHHSFPNITIEATNTAIRKLEAAGYRVFNISERGVEYSFICV